MRSWLSVGMVFFLWSAMLTVPTVSYAQGPGMQQQFTDIRGHWAETFIRTLRHMGVLPVPEDGLFHPDESVTRGDFTVWLARSIELLPVAEGPEAVFTDTADMDEDELGLILAAHQGGLISGYPDGTFRAGAKITRLEIGTILGRALVSLGVNAQARHFVQFVDGGIIPTWGAEAAAAVQKRIIIGNPRAGNMYFDPHQNTTRSQAATMIERFVQVRLEITGLPRPEPADVVPPGQIVAGYYINTNDAYLTLREHGDALNWLVYWSHELDAGGRLQGVNSPRTLAWAVETGRPVLALISNHNRAVNSAFLNDDAAQARAIQALKGLMDLGYSGVDINFEGIPAADRDRFTRFVRNLAMEFKAAGHIVSLSIPAKTRDLPASEWSGAFDYAALGQHADYVGIMTYDHHWRGGPAGPVGGVPWVRRVIQYAVSQMPAQKILLGIPAYGYDWPQSTGAGTGRAVTGRQAVELAQRHGTAITYDAVQGEGSFGYTDEQGIARIVYYTPAAGLELKLALVDEFNLAGSVMWRVGQEVLEFWPILAQLNGR